MPIPLQYASQSAAHALLVGAAIVSAFVLVMWLVSLGLDRASRAGRRYLQARRAPKPVLEPRCPYCGQDEGAHMQWDLSGPYWDCPDPSRERAA